MKTKSEILTMLSKPDDFLNYLHGLSIQEIHNQAESVASADDIDFNAAIQRFEIDNGLLGIDLTSNNSPASNVESFGIFIECWSQAVRTLRKTLPWYKRVFMHIMESFASAPTMNYGKTGPDGL